MDPRLTAPRVHIVSSERLLDPPDPRLVSPRLIRRKRLGERDRTQISIVEIDAYLRGFFSGLAQGAQTIVQSRHAAIVASIDDYDLVHTLYQRLGISPRRICRGGFAQFRSPCDIDLGHPCEEGHDGIAFAALKQIRRESSVPRRHDAV